MESISIPNRIVVDDKFYNVIAVENEAFFACWNVTEIKLPKNLKYIGNYAFTDCNNLPSINIPNSVTSIGYYAFSDCRSLISIIIPSSITSIGNYAFNECTSLISINIPNAVTYIGYNAFCECSSLREIMVDSNNKIYSSQDGVLFNKNRTELIQYPIGKENQTYTIPNSVTSIGFAAFWSSSLKSINIPNSVTYIDDCAFWGSNSLTSIDIPNSVTSIGGEAFLNCSSLTSVNIPNSVTSIGRYAFHGCSSLKKSAYPDHLSNPFGYGIAIAYPSGGIIEDGIVYGPEKNGLYFVPMDYSGEIDIPGTVKTVGENALAYCDRVFGIKLSDSEEEIVFESNELADLNVKSLYLGRKLENHASLFPRIQNLSIGNLFTEVPADAFKGRSTISSLTLGSKIESIGESAFEGCNLKGVAVPPSVKSIGDRAFASNANLRELKIGSGIKEVGASAFEGCNRIENIYVTAPVPPSAENSTFSRYESPLWLIDQEAFERYYNYSRCWYRFEDNMFTLVPIERISAPETEVSGKEGETLKLEVEISPADATLQEIFWSSTNPEIATVDNEGNVTFVSANTEAQSRAGAEECHIIATTMYADSPVLDFVVTVSPEAGIYDIYVDDSNGSRPSGSGNSGGNSGVYNLQGQYVGASTEGLPAGLYIANGRKIIVH